MKKFLSYLLISFLLTNSAIAQTTFANASTPTNTGQIIGTGSAPTCTVNTTYAGTGATCAVTGTSMDGTLTLNSGTGTTAGGTLVTVTYVAADTTARKACYLQPQNTNAVGQTTMVYSTAPSTTAWTLAVAGSAIPASISGYQYGYHCE